MTSQNGLSKALNSCKVSVSLPGFLLVGEILLMEEIRLTSYFVGYPIIYKVEKHPRCSRISEPINMIFRFEDAN